MKYMDLKDRISEYVDSHIDELVADVMELIGTDSSRSEALPGMPYGKGAAEVLKKGMAIFEKYGFASKNYDNYVITADMNGLEKGLDILAHLDVVPRGDGWTVTDAFKPVIKDGRIYGRGAIDDKGPSMAALLAMRAVRELGIPLKKNVRLILGSDEECGSSDIAYYFSKEKNAPMTFSPDADFPLINIEKGGLAGRFSGRFEKAPSGKARLVSFSGGKTTNVVPNKAHAVVEGIGPDKARETAERSTGRTGASFSIREQDGGIRIDVEGRSAHASTPFMGNNAVTALLDIITELDLCGETAEALKKLYSVFPHGDTDGTAAGVKMSDELSGDLTITLDILEAEDGRVSGVFDCRAPICANKENLYDVMAGKLKDAGLFFDEGVKMNPPHHADGNSFFVRTLLDCYEVYSGKKGEPMAIGGGTYVHHIDNGVAFGCEIEGIDNHMHGADEFADIDVLAMSAKIFALSIAELCS